jgi:predicted class III extradiol MEMO1 family dioxygenase
MVSGKVRERFYQKAGFAIVCGNDRSFKILGPDHKKLAADLGAFKERDGEIKRRLGLPLLKWIGFQTLSFDCISGT